jgi:hypothetical protein
MAGGVTAVLVGWLRAMSIPPALVRVEGEKPARHRRQAAEGSTKMRKIVVVEHLTSRPKRPTLGAFDA